MKTAKNKMLAVIMILIIAASLSPIVAYADDATPSTGTVAETISNEVQPYGMNAAADAQNDPVNAPDTIEIAGIITWNDNDNQDGRRPESITVNLMANGERTDSRAVTAAEGWAWSFTVPALNENGEAISYAINEDPVDGYDSSVSGYNITNSRSPETTEVSGKVIWNDNDNQDGKRPESITLDLMANGLEAGNLTVTKEDGWIWSFKGLPKYSGGSEIQYSVTAEPIQGYETTTEGFRITNTHLPETAEISGSLSWDDNSNQDGIRPTSVTVTLLAGSKKVGSQVLAPGEDSSWTWSFSALPIFEGKNRIYYSVSAEPVKGYDLTVEEFTLSYRHIPEATDVSGIKTWVDNNDQDGKRPDSATVYLLKNGEKIDSKTITPDSSGKWEWNFTGLPKYDGGKEIIYTVSEDPLDGYTTVVTGYNIAGTHAPEKINLENSVKWDDSGNQDGKRPAKMKINLLKNGTRICSKEIKPDTSGNWKWRFNDLPKYEIGKEVVYSVTADSVAGYFTVANGLDITNSYEPEKTSVSVSVIWIGGSAEKLTVRLYANGTEVTSGELNKDNNWKHSFDGLDMYSAGKKISYTLKEDDVSGFSSTVVNSKSGFKVINTIGEIPLADGSNNGIWALFVAYLRHTIGRCFM